MLKQLIKFSICLNTFLTVLISNINTVESVNRIYYSDAVKKVNDVRAKIDAALENLAEISNGIDRYRDALNDDNDSTNYEYYNGQKPYVIYKSEIYSNEFNSWSSSTQIARSCIYKFYGEEIFLNPHYITNVCATCYYVITSWAGNSWETMCNWFKDQSTTQYGICKNYDDKIFYIVDLKEDKEKVELSGHINMDKPSASIYMSVKLNSSEQLKPLLQEREYIHNHVGWAVFDSHLFHGKIMYAITDQSKTKLQNIRQKIADLKFEINSEVNKLNSYNPDLDYTNDDYENSNLNQILADCEQVCNKASAFIFLGESNYWIQKF